MKDHSGFKRQFVHLPSAWWANQTNHLDAEEDEAVIIGFYHDEGGTSGEFKIEWVAVNGSSVPRLVAYDDGWSALFEFGDLLEAMADIDDLSISSSDFCALLVSLGIEDATPTVRPNWK